MNDWPPGLIALMGISVGVPITESLLCLLRCVNRRKSAKPRTRTGKRRGGCKRKVRFLSLRISRRLRRIRFPRWLKPIAAVILSIAIASGLVFMLMWTFAALGWQRVAPLAIACWAGAIFGQAKDSAIKISRPVTSAHIRAEQSLPAHIRVRHIWKGVCGAFMATYSDENSAAFIYRFLEWGALAVAGAWLISLIMP